MRAQILQKPQKPSQPRFGFPLRAQNPLVRASRSAARTKPSVPSEEPRLGAPSHHPLVRGAPPRVPGGTRFQGWRHLTNGGSAFRAKQTSGRNYPVTAVRTPSKRSLPPGVERFERSPDLPNPEEGSPLPSSGTLLFGFSTMQIVALLTFQLVTAFVCDTCPAPPVSTRALPSLPCNDCADLSAFLLTALFQDQAFEPRGRHAPRTGYHSGSPTPYLVSHALLSIGRVGSSFEPRIEVCNKLPPVHSRQPRLHGRFRGGETRSTPLPILDAFSLFGTTSNRHHRQSLDGTPHS